VSGPVNLMARQFSELPRSGQLYLSAVIGVGLSAVANSVTSAIFADLGWDWVVLAALTLLTGSFSIKVPSVNARLSVSEAFVFAALLAYGQHVATIVVALDSLVLTSWLRRPSRSPLRVMFNMAAGALAITAAGQGLSSMVPTRPAALTQLDQLLFPVVLLAIAYFFINSWLVAIAVSYEQGVSAREIWRHNFLWFGLNYLGGASVALVLVNFTRNLNLTSIGVIVPFVVILYITFRTSWGRVEDANRYVAQVNDLYMSTIEALAMAVDAKDQITHGHIRRVQVFAVELAKRIGVDDEDQLKAIATAALLHDMGKLAIPEHILNKPGQLTAAEFEKMKRHADIGADLLSSVKFPYPVVPIVRHHHEHWDGSGYPAGISGTDIPLGARILSVVDCFDALTSDRPYRPRLTSDEAFRLIRSQRGTTYDPLIVDAFVKAYSEIAPFAIRAGEEARSMVHLTDAVLLPATDSSESLREIRAAASESALLDCCFRDILMAGSESASFEAAAQYLRQLTPATVYALFTYDSAVDFLRCTATVGDPHRMLHGFVIRLGERVTGWVGANRTTSVNSDASLDLVQIAGYFAPPLRSSISTPLCDGQDLLGVLTAYAVRDFAFQEGHRYAFEKVAAALVSKLVSQSSNAVPNVLSFPHQRSSS